MLAEIEAGGAATTVAFGHYSGDARLRKRFADEEFKFSI